MSPAKLLFLHRPTTKVVLTISTQTIARKQKQKPAIRMARSSVAL